MICAACLKAVSGHLSEGQVLGMKATGRCVGCFGALDFHLVVDFRFHGEAICAEAGVKERRKKSKMSFGK